MLSYEKALELVKKKIPFPETIQIVSLAQARGKVLARDVVSDTSFPPFRRSNMDGFAVRAEDVVQTPVVLKCIGESRAGKGFSGTVERGEACAIMTGAPLPDGADTVIMVEDTRREGDEVHVLSPGSMNQFVSVEGECLRAGEVGLEKGRFIRSYEVGILASLGVSEVPVFAPPKASILATGDELVETSQKPGPGQVRNSNTSSLCAHVARIGGIPRILGRAGDTPGDLKEKIRAGLKGDFLLVTGGVSMGKYDLVKDAFEEEGVEVFFTQVAIKPGKPSVFGKKGDTLVFGLPGNPVSTSVVFELLVKPALLLRMGLSGYRIPRIRGVYRGSFVASSDRRHFLPCKLFITEMPWRVETVAWHGSSDIFGTGRANSLMEIREGSKGIEDGDEVSVVPMEDLFL